MKSAFLPAAEINAVANHAVDNAKLLAAEVSLFVDSINGDIMKAANEGEYNTTIYFGCHEFEHVKMPHKCIMEEIKQQLCNCGYAASISFMPCDGIMYSIHVSWENKIC